MNCVPSFLTGKILVMKRNNFRSYKAQVPFLKCNKLLAPLPWQRYVIYGRSLNKDYYFFTSNIGLKMSYIALSHIFRGKEQNSNWLLFKTITRHRKLKNVATNRRSFLPFQKRFETPCLGRAKTLIYVWKIH